MTDSKLATISVLPAYAHPARVGFVFECTTWAYRLSAQGYRTESEQLLRIAANAVQGGEKGGLPPIWHYLEELAHIWARVFCPRVFGPEASSSAIFEGLGALNWLYACAEAVGETVKFRGDLQFYCGNCSTPRGRAYLERLDAVRALDPGKPGYYAATRDLMRAPIE